MYAWGYYFREKRKDARVKFLSSFADKTCKNVAVSFAIYVALSERLSACNNTRTPEWILTKYNILKF
jgi:hypothetical protein